MGSVNRHLAVILPRMSLTAAMIGGFTSMAHAIEVDPAAGYDVALTSYATNDGACQTTACWDVTSPSRQAISHFVVGLGTCEPLSATVTSLTHGGGTKSYDADDLDDAYDPTCQVYGIKFDDGFADGEVRRLCMTFAGILPIGDGNVTFDVKGGPSCAPTIGVDGPTCGQDAGCTVDGCEGTWVCGAEGAECVKDDPSCGTCQCESGVCDPVTGECVECLAADRDVCGECFGGGIPDGACDCAGNVKDECGVCGGPGAVLACGCSEMPDNACDCEGNVLDECGECGGPGAIYACGCSEMPDNACDCEGNVEDACGVCGGSATDPEACESCPAGATLDFGEVGWFNVMSCGDFVLGADTQGPAGVGGVASLAAVGIDTRYWCGQNGEISLMAVAGGIENGEVRGDAVVGPSFGVADNANVCGEVAVDDGLQAWFQGQCGALANLQDRLMALSPNGTAQDQWGTLHLSGQDPALNVFAVDASLLGAGNNGVVFNVPAGSTALVNVSGAEAWIRSYIGLNGLDRTRVLFNVDTAALHVENISLQGSILAPRTDLYFANGNIEGQTFAHHIHAPSSAEWHDFRFAGLTCPAPSDDGDEGGDDDGGEEGGVSTGGTGTAFVCDGACLGATALGPYQNSGGLGTGERWFKVSGALWGWQASEVWARTIEVNGVVVTPGQMPLPDKAADGAWYVRFAAGEPSWTSWGFW